MLGRWSSGTLGRWNSKCSGNGRTSVLLLREVRQRGGARCRHCWRGTVPPLLAWHPYQNLSCLRLVCCLFSSVSSVVYFPLSLLRSQSLRPTTGDLVVGSKSKITISISLKIAFLSVIYFGGFLTSQAIQCEWPLVKLNNVN